MDCSVCQSPRQLLYCAHCMNTSPGLLLRRKLALYEIRAGNRVLQQRVDSVLQDALDETSVEILASRLRQLQLAQWKRRNSRIRYRIRQMESVLDTKRKQMAQLQLEMEKQKVCHVRLSQDRDMQEVVEQGRLVNGVVARTRQMYIAKLNEWFLLSQRNSYKVPYTIQYQPVVSLKNIQQLPRDLVKSSLEKMFKYIQLLSQIVGCQVIGGNTHTKLETLLGVLVVDIVGICAWQGILGRCVDVGWLLDQYDIDLLFFNMATARRMDSKTADRPWTVDMVESIVTTTTATTTTSTSLGG